MSTIYLCGPIHGRTDEQCVSWRSVAKALWRGDVLDPMRRDYRGKELENPRQLVEDDLQDVRDADGLLVYFDAPSVGTSMEIFYARHVLKKPVVVVDVSGMKPLPVWLFYHANSIVSNVAQGIEALEALLDE